MTILKIFAGWLAIGVLCGIIIVDQPLSVIIAIILCLIFTVAMMIVEEIRRDK